MLDINNQRFLKMKSNIACYFPCQYSKDIELNTVIFQNNSASIVRSPHTAYAIVGRILDCISNSL